ncbi:Hypothetical predicted protein [Mytilus galloprovincialis]|uniref:Uncharacterized protein n=1 Tax=Mytilus galloprovincialis TaxID=29158 RepID=A0A8B6HG75_MYTGA|nr:Hypothetical predicted protein [Mytilus galloprovincialis]
MLSKLLNSGMPGTDGSVSDSDVACFGLMQNTFIKECYSNMSANIGQIVTRYEMCSLASKAYLTSLTPSNLLSFFKRTGIHPFYPQAFDKSVLKPSEVLQELTTEPKPFILTSNSSVFSMSDDKPENTVVHALAEGDLVVHQEHENDNPSQNINTFFTKRVSKLPTKSHQNQNYKWESSNWIK